MRKCLHSQLGLQDRMCLLIRCTMNAGSLHVGFEALLVPLQVVDAASDYETNTGNPDRSRIVLNSYQFLDLGVYTRSLFLDQHFRKWRRIEAA